MGFIRKQQSRLIFTGVAVLTLTGVVTAQTSTQPGETSPPATQPQEKLPSAEFLFAKHLSTIGGAESINAVKSLIVRGEFRQFSRGIRGDLSIYSMGSQRLVRIVDGTNRGSGRYGFTDGVAWSMTDSRGARILQGRQAETIRLEADLTANRIFSTKLSRCTTRGKTLFDGRWCFEVVILSPGDEETMAYFDVKTNLLAGTMASQIIEKHTLPFETVYKEYRNFNGILMPTTIESSMNMGGTKHLVSTAHIDSIEVNTVEESELALPEEIKALLSQKPDAPNDNQ